MKKCPAGGTGERTSTCLEGFWAGPGSRNLDRAPEIKLSWGHLPETQQEPAQVRRVERSVAPNASGPAFPLQTQREGAGRLLGMAAGSHRYSPLSREGAPWESPWSHNSDIRLITTVTTTTQVVYWLRARSEPWSYHTQPQFLTYKLERGPPPSEDCMTTSLYRSPDLGWDHSRLFIGIKPFIFKTTQ